MAKYESYEEWKKAVEATKKKTVAKPKETPKKAQVNK